MIMRGAVTNRSSRFPELGHNHMGHRSILRKEVCPFRFLRLTWTHE